MKSDDHDFVLSVLHGGGLLVAEISAIGVDCVGWVGVYPLNVEKKTTIEFLLSQGQKIPKKNEYVFHVRKFEIEKSLMNEDVWVSEMDLKNKSSFFAFGDDDLILGLQNWGLSLSELKSPVDSSYPI